MKNLSDFFSTEEIKKFLISKGFQIVQKTGEFPVIYLTSLSLQNEKITYLEVLKDGIPYKEKEYLHYDNPNLWIRNVFDEQMKNQLLGMKEEKKENGNDEKPTMVTLKYSGSRKRFEEEDKRRSFANWLANIISVERKDLKAYNPNEHDSYFWSIDVIGNNYWLLFDEEDADVFTIKTRYQFHADILASLAKYLVFRLSLEEV